MVDPNPKVDAFILFNEGENAVEAIVRELESRGVSTYFWRRDVPLGATWGRLEEQRLKDARTVLVFLGSSGWGPSHLQITRNAQIQQKRLIPLLIGDPQPSAFNEADGLFRDYRYLDLRTPDPASLAMLVDEIHRREPSQSSQFDRIISVLTDGNEEQRLDLLRQIRLSSSIDKPSLASRLRTEIRDRFSPLNEKEAGTAARSPKILSSIRSWMLSVMIWADADSPENEFFILDHLRQSLEPDHNVRYWTLAGLYQVQPAYLDDAVAIALSDDNPEVAALAEAIDSAAAPYAAEKFRSRLLSPEFDTARSVLRLLRTVPIPELARDVCLRLEQAQRGSALAYDALYALSNPVMAGEAAKLLSQNPGIDGVVERVIAESRGSNANAMKNFTVLMAAFDESEVDRALAKVEQSSETSYIAKRLRAYLNEHRRRDSSREVFVAGYVSDTIDIKKDPLDIREDVQTLTAVMLAKEVVPPLAIGLFGDWGSGKSYFMRSMRAAAMDLAKRSRVKPAAKFCSDIVQIEFNAWHYADTNLWASLVSYILEQLAGHVTPQPTPEQQQEALLLELGSAKTIFQEAETEKQRAQELITDRQKKLEELQIERQKKELRLRDLRMSDLKTLLSGREDLKTELRQSLEKIGAPGALNSVSDLSQVVSEAYTVRGRMTALFLALLEKSNRKVYLALLFIVLFIPVIAFIVQKATTADGLLVSVSTLVSEIVAVVTGAKVVLGKATSVVKENLDKVENVKQKVDEVIASKRAEITKEEMAIQKEIAELKAKEQEVLSRLAAAAARVQELEERLRTLKEGRSLARFLAERTRSDDYRKHLGLVSTIRQDFESLATRLANPGSDDNLRSVDRILLYIDDLDRCPADKVMEVLQAVHLLLAYPLFVVVVGVDPRWLLNALETTHSAFRSDDNRLNAAPGLWRTTPQNYLEKIFQIPFGLRPMTPAGYGKLMNGLLSPVVTPEPEGTRTDQTSTAESSRMNRKEPGEAPLPIPSGPAPTHSQEEGRTASGGGSPEFRVDEDSLVIREWEAKFAESLFQLIPTPRAAKRFSNIYRLLKASVRRERLSHFEGTAEVPGEFQVPMLLLAILIGTGAEGVALLPKLYEAAARGEDLSRALQRFETLGLDSPAYKGLEEKIRPIVSDSGFSLVPETFIEWLPRVSRFSFELGRVIPPVTSS